MNRLILVGNGFDLAHGLKTSYKDFIIWYLAKCLGSRSYVPCIYEDELMKIVFGDLDSFNQVINAHKPGFYHSSFTMEDLTFFISNHFKDKTIKELLNISENNISDLITSSSDDNFTNHHNREPFRVTILSDFLRSLIINCQDCNWVDIENEYFDQLKACKNGNGSFNKERVVKLNSEFAYLKQKLEAYLVLQQDQGDIKVIPELLNAINAKFEISDFEPIMGYKNTRLALGKNKKNDFELLHDLYFLNFNYTNTAQAYLDKLDTIRTDFSSIEVNYIHGQLNEANNPIIFGFGDEHDKNYLEFEEYRNNELFDHIKSYQYLRTPNYRNLLKFLNNGSYQIFVMGHSCGLSDRTMFKEIFEHENCKSIRLFHYNGDFHDKAINVSKHFSNKGHMRKLIVDYKIEDAFPQKQQAQP